MENARKNLFSYKIIIALALILVSLIFVSSVSAATYVIDDYTVDAKIMKNGDMHVEEYLKYDFNENMNGLYRNLLYKYNFSKQNDGIEATSSRYQASNVLNIKAFVSDQNFGDLKEATLQSESTLSNGMNGYFSITDVVSNGYRKNIKVYSPVLSSHSKYVKYEYDLEDVAVKYNDAGEIYWNFVGGDWECKIRNLNLNVTFENTEPVEGEIFVYPHSYTKVLNYEVDENVIKVNAKNINANTAVDARIIFPTKYLVSATKSVSENYDFTLLNKVESKMENGRNRYFLSNNILIILSIGGILGLIVILVETHKISSKGKKKGSNIEICTEMLDKYSLGQYSTLLNSYGGYSNSNLLLATILDLSNRKYIIMEPQKKLKNEFFSGIEYNYNMKLDPSKDYSVLNEYEIGIINYLFNGKVGSITDINSFEKQNFELNERLKEISKSYLNKERYVKFVQKLDKNAVKEVHEPVHRKAIIGSIIFVLIYLVVLLINIFVISPIVNEFATFVLGASFVLSIIAVSFISAAKSLKEEYVEEYNRLVGLKKYLKEYSVLKERYPIEMELWNKYLVFASLFGIADKVSKEFKEELIAKGYDEDYIYMNHVYLNISMHSTSITSSISSSTGTSSSGGYSGSGSGGGGGRRRWRWRLLYSIV